MIAVAEYSLVDQYVLIFKPFPRYGYIPEGADPETVMLPTEWGLVLEEVGRGFFRVRMLGQAGGSFDAGGDRVVALADMKGWLFFEDREEMREEMRDTWDPVWKLWGMEREWARQSASVPEAEAPAPATPRAPYVPKPKAPSVPRLDVDMDAAQRLLEQNRDDS